MLLAAGTLGGCSSKENPRELGPAAYTAPEPGTVYEYSGLKNSIVSVDGWRTHYKDGRGREGVRIAHFITDDPSRPITVDTTELKQLWPLRLGKETKVTVKRGDEVWEWEFRVVGTEMVFVPAGEYMTYIVQAVESPKLVRDPKSAYSASYSWWYAPRANAVVKFKTTYLSGPATGREFGSELEGISTSE